MILGGTYSHPTVSGCPVTLHHHHLLTPPLLRVVLYAGLGTKSGSGFEFSTRIPSLSASTFGNPSVFLWLSLLFRHDDYGPPSWLSFDGGDRISDIFSCCYIITLTDLPISSHCSACSFSLFPAVHTYRIPSSPTFTVAGWDRRAPAFPEPDRRRSPDPLTSRFLAELLPITSSLHCCTQQAGSSGTKIVINCEYPYLFRGQRASLSPPLCMYFSRHTFCIPSFQTILTPRV
jgi:hypothetical protein